MGSSFAKMFHRKNATSRANLPEVLLRLSPDVLLTLAVNNQEIYELCRNHELLRQACIVAAVRKYHSEKFLYEQVQNRTANYMVILDEFLKLQDESEANKPKKSFGMKYFKWISKRQGDSARGLARNVEETKGGGDGTKGDVEARDAVEDRVENAELNGNYVYGGFMNGQNVVEDGCEFS